MTHFLVLSLAASTLLFGSVDEVRERLQRRDFLAALTIAERDLKATPSSAVLWTLKGFALDGLNRRAEALTALRTAHRLQPAFVPTLQALAQMEYASGDAGARSSLEQLLRLRPDLPEAHAMLGVLAFERNDCPAAAAYFAKGIEKADHPVARWQYAACLARLEEWEAAGAQFEALLRVREQSEIRYNLALARLEAKRPADAIATLAPLAGQSVPEADVLSLLAAAYEADRKTPQALDTLRRAIQLYPRDERLYIDLANICLERNALDIGAEVLETGERNIPASSRIPMMLGLVRARAGERAKAEAAFAEARRRAPDSSLGSLGLAVSLLEMGAWAEAIDLLRPLARQSPNDPRVNLTLARALLRDEQSDAERTEAEALLHRVIREDPKQATAYALLGKLQFQRGEWLPAAKTLETAVRLDPKDRPAAYQLMSVYRRLGRAAEASAMQERVRRLLDEERAAEAEAGRYRLVRGPQESAR